LSTIIAFTRAAMSDIVVGYLVKIGGKSKKKGL
jgi:hypothetical protein